MRVKWKTRSFSFLKGLWLLQIRQWKTFWDVDGEDDDDGWIGDNLMQCWGSTLFCSLGSTDCKTGVGFGDSMTTTSFSFLDQSWIISTSWPESLFDSLSMSLLRLLASNSSSLLSGFLSSLDLDGWTTSLDLFRWWLKGRPSEARILGSGRVFGTKGCADFSRGSGDLKQVQFIQFN